MATKATFTVAKIYRGIGDFTVNDEGRLRNAINGIAQDTEVSYAREDIPLSVEHGASSVERIVCTAVFQSDTLNQKSIHTILMRTGLQYIAFGAIGIERLVPATT